MQMLPEEILEQIYKEVHRLGITQVNEEFGKLLYWDDFWAGRGIHSCYGRLVFNYRALPPRGPHADMIFRVSIPKGTYKVIDALLPADYGAIRN